MARPGSVRSPGLGPWGALVTLLVVAIAGSLLSACTSEGSGPPDTDNPTATALRVTTVTGSGLSEDARARLESDVSDVLARYVQAGFLGDYPRGGFVQSFADFTSRAAEQAVGDIDVLTAARYENADSVRATDLGAKLSFYVVDGKAVGATAWIHFAFDVDDHGQPRTAILAGRLVLDRRDGRWSVFAYQVHRDDSDTLPTEATSS
jgi:hypothetical protein